MTDNDDNDIVTINGYTYVANNGEFVLTPHSEYTTLNIYPVVGILEKIIGFLNELVEEKNNTNILIYGWNYGGFIPINCSKVYSTVYVRVNDGTIKMCSNKPDNLYFNNYLQIDLSPDVIFIDNMNYNNNTVHNTVYDVDDIFKRYLNSYILSYTDYDTDSHIKIHISKLYLRIYIPNRCYLDFYNRFKYYMNDKNVLDYDNLIHICIMVKNAGSIFEKVLNENLPYIDRWTILDTGSTDGTQDIVRKVLNNKKGNLYEEPFINFRDSRNRCLELAGNKCKYIIMLDDTYIIKNDLRSFLNIIRGDQRGTSYSLLIKSDDNEYYSNRVFISENKLRYIYKIHEVIQIDNNDYNIIIPKHDGYIYDYRIDYMEKRTMDRKKYDIDMLYEMVEEDPNNPRHYYYLAQTYNLLNDYENSAKWFYKRATTTLKGHIQEIHDSWFEMARIYNFKLNKPWDECKILYENAYNIDKTRPEPLYFIGIHYYLEGDKYTAYKYFRDAFVLGYPIHTQFSLKPTLVFYYLPIFLTELCYIYDDWVLGMESSKRYILNNSQYSDKYNEQLSWYNIFKLLCSIPDMNTNTDTKVEINKPDKPYIVFVADGGWDKWKGSDILLEGVGGSETYVIEMSRWIQHNGKYNCVVFCNCSESEVFEGVQYMDLMNYPEFIMNNIIDTVIINRYSEYIPLTINGCVDNIYIIAHDVELSGIVIPIHHKIKKILCLTDWHKDLFTDIFNIFKDRIEVFNYGIDIEQFKPGNKIKNSFIYSSFPNRGLLPLLKMWSKIKNAIPDATLNIYSNIDNNWVNTVAKDQIDEIRKILDQGLEGVTLHGWVSKKELADAWSKADIWLYPCIFKETYCLTAMEAAATKTLAITTPLAALNETVGNRGILIDGNPMEDTWIDNTIRELLDILSDSYRKNKLLEDNYNWAIGNTWKNRGYEFIKKYL